MYAIIDEFTGLVKVSNSFIVDGEVTDGSSVLGTHVTDSGSVGDGKLMDTGPEELDEFTNDSNLNVTNKFSYSSLLFFYKCSTK